MRISNLHRALSQTERNPFNHLGPENKGRSQTHVGVHFVREEGVDKTGGGVGKEQIPEYIQDLLAGLQDFDRSVRFDAVWALGDMGEKARAAVPSLIYILKNDPDEKVRCTAVLVLCNIGGEQAVSAVISTLKDTNADVRFEAAWALGIMEKEASAAVEALTIVASKDSVAVVRVAAQDALEAIQDS